MKTLIRLLLSASIACISITNSLYAQDYQFNKNKFMEEKLNLTQEWDKVFPKSDKVSHSKITFHNRYCI